MTMVDGCKSIWITCFMARRYREVALALAAAAVPAFFLVRAVDDQRGAIIPSVGLLPVALVLWFTWREGRGFRSRRYQARERGDLAYGIGSSMPPKATAVMWAFNAVMFGYLTSVNVTGPRSSLLSTAFTGGYTVFALLAAGYALLPNSQPQRDYDAWKQRRDLPPPPSVGAGAPTSPG